MKTMPPVLYGEHRFGSPVFSLFRMAQTILVMRAGFE